MTTNGKKIVQYSNLRYPKVTLSDSLNSANQLPNNEKKQIIVTNKRSVDSEIKKE